MGPQVTADDFAQARQRVQAATDLDPEQVESILQLLQQGEEQLSVAEDWKRQAKDFEQQRLDAPGQLESIRKDLATDLPAPVPEVPQGASVAQLEQLLKQSEAELATAQQKVSDLAAEAQRRGERRAAVPTAAAEARTRQAQIESELAAPTPEGQPAELSTAQRLLARARHMAVAAELSAYEQELLSYDARGELLAARREQAARRATWADKLTKAWRDVVNERRSAEAQRAAEQARQEAERSREHAQVTTLAAENAEIAQRRSDLAQHIEAATKSLETMRAALSNLLERMESVERKVAEVGLTQPIGILLVDERSALEDVRAHRAAVEARADEIADTRLDRIEVEEEKEALVDPAPRVASIMAQIDEGPDPPADTAERVRIEQAVRDKLQARKKLLDDLHDDYETYVDQLQDLDAEERQLIDKTVAYRDYIDQRVLWVRTASALHDRPLGEGGVPARSLAAVRWLLDAGAWGDALGRAVTRLPANPVVAAELLFVLLLFLLRSRLRRRVVDDAYLVGRIRSDGFRHTLRTGLLTLLIALPLPALLWVAGDLLKRCAAPSGVVRSVAEGLAGTVGVLFAAEVLWVTCRPKGLAEAHFRWPVANLRLLRRNLRWAVPVGLSMVFLVDTLQWNGEEAYIDSLGRLSFIAGQIVATLFTFRVLRLKGGVLTSTMERHPRGWLSRLRWLWFPLAVGLPLMLAVLSELGYVYTAGRLQERLQQSVWLVLMLAALHSLALRWLFVVRRQLALRQYMKRRDAAREAERARADQAGEDGDGKPAGATLSDEALEEGAIDIPAVSAQSQRLVVTAVSVSLVLGLFWVWVDVLPALHVFDKVELWSHTVQAEVASPTSDEPDRVITVARPEPITLGDLLLALVLLVLTFVGASNLPGLLEITLLQKLPLQRAGRYAITTLARYAIALLGVVLVFRAIGIGWSTVQWLAAGVSVGLGFGLQEIFANFVSGLILLVERPIRVGDTVTVASVTGAVTRIQMRATTIVTWDRTELVVPNREFITSQLVNWTLSDSVLRVVATVGIAYGSDVELAEQILLEIARDDPEILADPEPKVVFTAFGDSTLDFELRVFVADPEQFRVIHHSINKAIDRRFKEAGVEIAFPQRDLHLRTSDVALRVVSRRDEGPPAGSPEIEPA